MAVKTNSGVAVLSHLEHVKGVVGLLARHAVFYEAFSLPLLIAVFLRIVITPLLLCVYPKISSTIKSSLWRLALRQLSRNAYNR